MGGSVSAIPDRPFPARVAHVRPDRHHYYEGSLDRSEWYKGAGLFPHEEAEGPGPGHASLWAVRIGGSAEEIPDPALTSISVCFPIKTTNLQIKLFRPGKGEENIRQDVYPRGLFLRGRSADRE